MLKGSKSKPATSQTSEGLPNVEPQELSKVYVLINSEISSHRYCGEQECELSLVRTLLRRYYGEQGRELSLVNLHHTDITANKSMNCRL